MDPWIWSVLLLAIGLILLVLEFFIPSAGVLSVLAAGCIVASLIVAFISSFRFGVTMLIITGCILPLVVASAVRWWPHTPIGRLILIEPPENPDDVLPETEEYRGLKSLVGRIGTARTKMLPSGSVQIDERLYDALSQGMPIEPGTPIQVVDVRTNRLIVRVADGNNLRKPADPRDMLSQPIDSLGLEDFREPS